MAKLGILLCAGIISISGGSALAQSFTMDNNANSNSTSGATAIAIGSSNTSPDRIRTTVPAISPGLVAAGVHSCAGSASAGIGATGWGFGIGSTYEMRECNRRAYASALAGLGHRSAALDLVCLNKEVRASLNATGIVCPSQGIAARQVFYRTTPQVAAVAMAAPAPRAQPARAPAGNKRTYSAKALGLSSKDLEAKGCTLRNDSQKGRAWFCPRPVM
ncbi:hypothetical protein [Pseudochrobactrum kiredjianiae]|uniref:Uncharacterized protein n=1 Tax=Pseudochrobactrum kiredjianiae TaxID=386305 RepID=A0ABW3V136_9HYPH|nr:hypothetical protein [Pseudochrobactrum kiredjianiae]MDM7853185.1 hypothetical protein [Pseudochrobactrum kiredjianiae]